MNNDQDQNLDAAPKLPTAEQYQLERAKIAHDEFCRQMEEMGVTAFVQGFEFEKRTQEHCEAWHRVCDIVLNHWLETEFHQALRNPDRLMAAAAAIQVAADEELSPTKCLAHGIATFVIDVLDPTLLEKDSANE